MPFFLFFFLFSTAGGAELVFGDFSGQTSVEISAAKFLRKSVESALVKSRVVRLLDRSQLDAAKREMDISSLGQKELEIDFGVAKFILHCEIRELSQGLFRNTFSLVDLRTMEKSYSRTLGFEDENSLRELTDFFVQDLEAYFEKIPGKDRQKAQGRDSLLRAESLIWTKYGFEEWKLKDFVYSGKSLETFLDSESPSETTVFWSAMAPCWSGWNATGNVLKGAAWTLAEAALLVYALNQQPGSAKLLAFSAFVPLTFVDWWLSKKTGEKKRQRATRLRRHYKEHPPKFR